MYLFNSGFIIQCSDFATGW